MSKTKALLITILGAIVAFGCVIVGTIALAIFSSAIIWYCPPMC